MNNMGSITKVVERLFFKLLPVQIILIAMGSINSIIDGTIAGHYIDEKTVGVIGLFYAVIIIISAISSIILSGGAVLSGNYIGTKKATFTIGRRNVASAKASVANAVYNGKRMAKAILK